MIQRRTILWGSLLGGGGLLLLAIIVLLNQSDHFLPEFIQRYWPGVLILAGIWAAFARLRFKEDAWAGMDYGTGLYVIRHRRQGRTSIWIVIILLVIGGGLLLLNLATEANPSIGPIVTMILGVLFVLRGLMQ